MHHATNKMEFNVKDLQLDLSHLIRTVEELRDKVAIEMSVEEREEFHRVCRMDDGEYLLYLKGI